MGQIGKGELIGGEVGGGWHRDRRENIRSYRGRPDPIDQVLSPVQKGWTTLSKISII